MYIIATVEDKMNNDIAKILISEEKLSAIVQKLASSIDRDYKDSNRRVVLLGILKGSVVFMGDML